jgi:transposase-like protein
MIRWGYYKRRGLPVTSRINIQRVRCKKCGRTTNVLPCFLLAQKSYTVTIVKELVKTFINHPQDWKQLFDIDIDLATAYRWLRLLTRQANQAMPEIRKALLQLKPCYKLIDQLNDKPVPLTPRSKLLQRFISLAQKLHRQAVRLVGKNKPISSDYFCFLNYFLADNTGKALLQS